MRHTKKPSYKIDHEKRTSRRTARRTVKHTHALISENGEQLAKAESELEISPEIAEGRQLVAQMARAFIGTVEFYKSEFGGSKPHSEAVKEALSLDESRRAYIEGLDTERIEWNHIAAVGAANMQDGLSMWARVREAADDELESGRRASKVAGDHSSPYAYAQFLAIRDQFADQWQPTGGIEAAMIDMLTVAFSLQMYWSTIAHQRATRTHDEQRKAVERFESGGWKSPYQSEADGIDQAHRLADGYNRQFLRVLRQLRDLRRYAPPVIINNGGQVNLANQQVNVSSDTSGNT